jgi:GNAT superfamily N-acetyltransferase
MTFEGDGSLDLEVRRAFANDLGAPGEPLDDGRVIVVARPDDHWGYVACGAAFADATLVAVEPDLLPTARDASPGTHGPGALLQILSTTRDAARDADRDGTLHAPGIGWVVAHPSREAALPTGMQMEVVEADALSALIEDGRFENGAGRSDGADGRSFRNQCGLVLRADDEIVAVAGVFLSYGLHEIGVDVTERHRGRGLGRFVVSAAVEEIQRRGEVPFYGCSPTNIVSQRTALSAGFLPVLSSASIT